jgi:SAM-dependent methyltransferase
VTLETSGNESTIVDSFCNPACFMDETRENPAIDYALQEASAWDVLWGKLFDKYQADIRHAYYIAALRRRNERRLLEIAAGSFRDAAALNRWGLSCDGVDFSPESVEKARSAFAIFSNRIRQMDATRLDYADKVFDLSYHNGFWGYFDDADIYRLGTEQARVTKRRMIATVHNAHHEMFRRNFAERGKADSLYRIRFFHAEEIATLMRRFCRRVTVLPVGGGRVDRLIRRGYSAGIVRWPFLLRVFGLKQFSRFDIGERLMCIGEVP